MRKIKQTVGKVLLIILLIITYQKVLNYLEKENKQESIKIEERINVDNYPFQIQFIDVGEADCILINNNKQYALIDAGNNKDGKKLVSYFKSIGIEKFQYVIGTHAHEDHIGGMDNIIKNFEIKHFYMPNVEVDMITYQEIKKELQKKNILYETPKLDNTLTLSNAKIKVLSIGDDKEDINSTSIVLKVTYQNTSYLLMADATSDVEQKILNKNIQSDLIKIGHHGSNHSSSATFLNKVKPKYAIISVGTPNDYGFPKKVTLDKLERIGANILRTDELGTIIASSDGNNIYFNYLKTDTNYIEK